LRRHAVKTGMTSNRFQNMHTNVTIFQELSRVFLGEVGPPGEKPLSSPMSPWFLKKKWCRRLRMLL